MKLNTQKGFAHIIILLVLMVGLFGGLYLVTHPTIFKPKAFEEPKLEYLANLEETAGLYESDCYRNPNASTGEPTTSLIATFTDQQIGNQGSFQHICFKWPLSLINGSSGLEGQRSDIVSGDFKNVGSDGTIEGTIEPGQVRFPGKPDLDYGCGNFITTFSFRFTDNLGRKGTYNGCIDDLNPARSMPHGFNRAWGTYVYDIAPSPTSNVLIEAPPTLSSCEVSIMANNHSDVLVVPNAPADITLSWVSPASQGNQLHASGNWGPGEVNLYGSTVVSPQSAGTYDYSLACIDDNGNSKTSSVKVVVSDLNALPSVEPTPNSTPGCGALQTYCSFTSQCKYVWEECNAPPSSPPANPPTSSANSSCEVNITANDTAPNLSIPKAPADVTLSWTSTGDSDGQLHATGNWGPGEVSQSGTTVVSPQSSGNFVYNLSCVGGDGVTKTTSVNVNVGN